MSQWNTDCDKRLEELLDELNLSDQTQRPRNNPKGILIPRPIVSAALIPETRDQARNYFRAVIEAFVIHSCSSWKDTKKELEAVTNATTRRELKSRIDQLPFVSRQYLEIAATRLEQRLVMDSSDPDDIPERQNWIAEAPHLLISSANVAIGFLRNMPRNQPPRIPPVLRNVDGERYGVPLYQLVAFLWTLWNQFQGWPSPRQKNWDGKGKPRPKIPEFSPFDDWCGNVLTLCQKAGAPKEVGPSVMNHWKGRIAAEAQRAAQGNLALAAELERMSPGIGAWLAGNPDRTPIQESALLPQRERAVPKLAGHGRPISEDVFGEEPPDKGGAG